jgi:hypothetical protein
MQAWQELYNLRSTFSSVDRNCIYFRRNDNSVGASAAVQLLQQHVKAAVESGSSSFATSPAAVQLTADALLLQHWWVELLEQQQQQQDSGNAAVPKHTWPLELASEHLKHLQQLLDEQLEAAAGCARAGVSQQQQQQQQQRRGKTLLVVTWLEAQQAAAAAAAAAGGGDSPAAGASAAASAAGGGDLPAAVASSSSAAEASSDGHHETPPATAAWVLHRLLYMTNLAGVAKTNCFVHALQLSCNHGAAGSSQCCKLFKCSRFAGWLAQHKAALLASSKR